MTDPATGLAPSGPSAIGSQYGESYFSHHLGGVPYSDTNHWVGFFGAVAEMIVRDLAPKTVLDAGSAMGYLVEALRQRGVEAWGCDVSEYAIQNARPEAREYCWVGSIQDAFPRNYDLITCIEVIEHLPPGEAPRAIQNLCTHTDQVLFTSTPLDFGEETHFNVRPPEYWADLFAKNGFFRDVDFEAPELAFWACRYQRSRETIPRIVASYERVIWHYRHAAYERDKLLSRQLHAIDENERLTADVKSLRENLDSTQQRLSEAEDELHRLQHDVSTSTAGRLALSLQSRVRTLAPAGTKRYRALRNAAALAARLIAGRARI